MTERANFSCPSCDSTEIYRVTGTEGTFECRSCGGKTHEKIEECRDDLEALARSDNPAGELASLLVPEVGQ